jgi:Xaa-Pro aminopeptidase
MTQDEGRIRRRSFVLRQNQEEIMRLAKLRQAITQSEERLDALLVYQPENRRYISGFTGSEAMLFITPERAVLATDSRYWEQAEHEAPEFSVYQVKTKYVTEMADILKAAGDPRCIGFESTFITVDQLDQLMDAAPEVEWVATKGMVEDLRLIKDESEIELMQQAARIADQGFEFLRQTLRPGMTERQASWELEAFMRTHGADKIAFDLIVGSGPNGAMPHHHSDSRVIQAGEPIVLDLGAQVGGYHSDLTRTICLGQPQDGRFLEIYDIVRRAQETALHGIRAGMPGVEADKLARDVIEAAGYGDNFGHGLGHGVGLAVHESPRAGRTSEDTLLAGSTLTIEPGIYISGWGGVRIEDLTRIGENGVQLLSRASKEPLVLQHP